MKRLEFIKSLVVGGSLLFAGITIPTKSKGIRYAENHNYTNRSLIPKADVDKIVTLSDGSWFYVEEDRVQREFMLELERKLCSI